MKYYYGNSYKEALSNKPITIRSVKQLRGYEEAYSFVIPADEVESDYDLALEDDSYQLDTDKGILKIDKQVFDEFKQDSIIKILFTDDDTTYEYKMLSEDDEYIYLEYFGD